MVNKISKKVLSILLLLIVFILSFQLISYVKAAFDPYTPEEFTTDGSITTNGTGKVATTGGQIVGMIQIVGTIVSVGMMIVLGIKYMMGSAEERAEYKKTMFPYLIGAVLIFAAVNLAQIVYNWADKL